MNYETRKIMETIELLIDAETFSMDLGAGKKIEDAKNILKELI